MYMTNYAGIYLKKKNRVLDMNTVRYLRWSVLQKALHNQGLSFQNQVFRFSKRAGEALPSLPSSTHESVAEFPSISLDIPKYP